MKEDMKFSQSAGEESWIAGGDGVTSWLIVLNKNLGFMLIANNQIGRVDSSHIFNSLVQVDIKCVTKEVHLWSETKSCIFRELRDRSRVKSKSTVCPRLCVGPETCCTRLKDLQMFKKFVKFLSIWMLKSPAIMALSNLSTREGRSSENSLRKPLLEFEFGGRLIIIQKMGSLRINLIVEISKLLKEPRLSGVQEKCFLKDSCNWWGYCSCVSGWAELY